MISDLATKSDLKVLEVKFEEELKFLKWMLGFVRSGIAALIIKAFFT